MIKTGKIFWQDLTVEDAEHLRDFYSKVVGWTFEKVNQGEYDDYNMINPEDKEVVAGICHRRGELQDLPSQWLNYVMVEDMENSLAQCLAHGGRIIDGPKNMGQAKFVVIQDPAGAYLALMEE